MLSLPNQRNVTSHHRRPLGSLQHDSLRTTDFIFKKTITNDQTICSNTIQFKSLSKKPQEVNGSKNLVLRDPPRTTTSLTIQSPKQLSCTSFMKSYTEKLKKQRKRQTKKPHLSKAQKLKMDEKKNSSFKIQEIPLCRMNKPNQILILERIPQNGNYKGLNTISLVSQQIYKNDNQILSKGKQRVQSPDWTKKQKIDQIIKGIRNSRKKMVGIDDLYEFEEAQKPINSESNSDQFGFLGFPKLETIKKRKKQKKILDIGIKSKKISESFNYNILQPWKQESKAADFCLLEFDHELN